jgi:hypothetical protein
VAFDFDDDCHSDILWRQETSGNNALWLMHGLSRKSGPTALLTLADTNWRVAGSGDFNGDGRADILWRNTQTGDNAIWLMHGRERLNQTTAIPRLRDVRWQVVGVGDFNGDKQADILWRHTATGHNALWLMHGLTRTNSKTTLTPLANTDWAVVGVGDFNANGKADILWRNTRTGANAIWLMHGRRRTNAQTTVPSIRNVDWQVVGVGDSNGDEKADILWRNTQTGENAIWLMHGLSRTNDQTALPNVANRAMQVMGMGDFNGDGKADILWRNTQTGGNAIWLLDGRRRTNTHTSVAAQTNLHWRVVGHNSHDYDGTEGAEPAAATDEVAGVEESEALSAEPCVTTVADAAAGDDAMGEQYGG